MPTKKTKIMVKEDGKNVSAVKKPGTKPTVKAARSAKPVMDIAPPGGLKPADATTRPIIITNRPVLSDPMMLTELPGSEVTPTEESLRTPETAKVVVRPLSQADADLDADGIAELGEVRKSTPVEAADEEPGNSAKIPGSPEETPKKSETAPEPSTIPGGAHAPKPTPEEAPAEKSNTSDKPAPADKAAADDSAESDAAPIDSQSQLDAELAASAKAMEEIDDLVEEKTYFLPINSHEKRRSRNVFIFGAFLIVVLALLWLNIALDAGFVQIDGVRPLTHFFTTP